MSVLPPIPIVVTTLTTVLLYRGLSTNTMSWLLVRSSPMGLWTSRTRLKPQRSDTVVPTMITTSVDAQNFQNKNFNQNIKQVRFKDLLPLNTQELELTKNKARTMPTPASSKTPSAPKKYSAFARASSLLPTFQPGPEDYETPMNQGVYNMPATHPGMYRPSLGDTFEGGFALLVLPSTKLHHGTSECARRNTFLHFPCIWQIPKMPWWRSHWSPRSISP